MTETGSLLQQIKSPKSKIFRRFYVKRRSASTGQFESSWQDLTEYVIKWGSFRWSVDTPRFGDLRLDNGNVRVLNIDGSFNPNDNESSHWFGYGDIQRSLVKIEAGFLHQTLSAGGIWTNTEYPTNPTFWLGIISGDIFLTGRAEVNLPIRPITQVFRDFPANDVTGWTSTGLSSGGWFAMLRDMTDGAGSFVFRPFIGTGASNDWDIATGSAILYSALNTSSAEQLYDLDVWAVTERLARGENKLVYIDQSGKFVWQSKSATASNQFEFHGLGSQTDRTYGQTIKKINSYGKRLTAYFSRVAVKYVNLDTSTSFVNTGLAFTITGANTAWNLGQRTYRIDNFWLPNSAAAANLAAQIFSEVSSQTEEISFTTTFVPHLRLMDQVSVNYDASDFVSARSFWDMNDWAESVTNSAEDLIWDPGRGDAIILQSASFKLLSIDIDLDNLETTFIARKI